MEIHCTWTVATPWGSNMASEYLRLDWLWMETAADMVANEMNFLSKQSFSFHWMYSWKLKNSSDKKYCTDDMYLWYQT